MFRLHNCRQETTVRELREELDLVSGIPYHFQRVCYLDQGVLMDDSTLGFHDVVPGGTLSMYIWPQDGWKELVFAAVEGDTSKLSCLGVTEDSLYRTPHSLLLKAKKLKEWIDDRAFVALYITAHRGHSEALRFLLANGTNCQGRTPLGRTALHAAAATGQITTINLLLDYGALLSDKDFKGETVAEIARRLKSKEVELNFLKELMSEKKLVFHSDICSAAELIWKGQYIVLSLILKVLNSNVYLGRILKFNPRFPQKTEKMTKQWKNYNERQLSLKQNLRGYLTLHSPSLSTFLQMKKLRLQKVKKLNPK
uniref:Ubiquitin-like domain-containing protein n=2 Tax=Monodelphis domestica TaxID=13616 RepID=F6X8J8_MONDO